MFYDYYDAADDEVAALLGEIELGRLVTVAADGTPHIGLYPFVARDAVVEIHLNAADEQIVDLRENARCLFEVDDALAVIPSYWIHPDNAVFATAYHRTVVLECRARIDADPHAIAEQQGRLMARYQPEGGFRAVDANDTMYASMLAKLVAVTLDVQRVRAKFKLAQNRTEAVRASVASRLRDRGRTLDERAAAALEATID
jgi:uncharacterized protein